MVHAYRRGRRQPGWYSVDRAARTIRTGGGVCTHAAPIGKTCTHAQPSRRLAKDERYCCAQQESRRRALMQQPLWDKRSKMNGKEDGDLPRWRQPTNNPPTRPTRHGQSVSACQTASSWGFAGLAGSLLLKHPHYRPHPRLQLRQPPPHPEPGVGHHQQQQGEEEGVPPASLKSIPPRAMGRLYPDEA